MTTIYNLGAEASASIPTHAARLAWSRPRFRELDPVTEEPIGPWNPLPSDAQHIGSARLTVDAPTSHASTSALVLTRESGRMNAFIRPAKHTFVGIGEIDLSHTIRPHNASVVTELAQSIRAMGYRRLSRASFAMASMFSSPVGTNSKRCA